MGDAADFVLTRLPKGIYFRGLGLIVAQEVSHRHQLAKAQSAYQVLKCPIYAPFMTPFDQNEREKAS